MTQGTHFGPFLVSPHKRSGKLSGRWLVTIPKTIAGKRTRKFFENRRTAEQYAKKLLGRYNRGQLSKPEPTPKERITFRQAVEEWKELQKDRVGARRKRAVSLKTDAFRLNQALRFLGNDLLTEITDRTLLQFQKHRLDAGRSPQTVNSDLKKVKQVLNWARKKKYIDIVPEIEPEPEDIKNRHIPQMEEVFRIVEHLPQRLQPLVTFMAVTGCRSGEAFNLKWDCVDIAQRTVRFEPNGGWTPKTKASVRSVPVSRKLLEILVNQRKDGDYVFRGKVKNKPISNIRKAFKTAVRKAGIKRDGNPFNVTPHMLRKAYATHQAVERKLPMPVLKSLLGHSPNSEVTDRYYVIPQKDSIRQAVFELPVSAMKGGEQVAQRGNNMATG